MTGQAAYFSLCQGIRDTLPVDRIEIEPTFSATSGAFEPRLSLGKNFSEDLSGDVSTTFGAETRQRVELEYRLTERMSAVGSWESETGDEEGAVGGGLKFTYPFRRVPWLSRTKSWLGGEDGEEE